MNGTLAATSYGIPEWKCRNLECGSPSSLQSLVTTVASPRTRFPGTGIYGATKSPLTTRAKGCGPLGTLNDLTVTA
jgi:hypothetical protein